MTPDNPLAVALRRDRHRDLLAYNLACPMCDGSGVEPIQAGIRTCPWCWGNGAMPPRESGWDRLLRDVQESRRNHPSYRDWTPLEGT